MIPPFCIWEGSSWAKNTLDLIVFEQYGDGNFFHDF
jgi:hypothetical protein